MSGKHAEYDPLFHEVADVLRWQKKEWPHELLHYTKMATFQSIVETKSIVLFNPLSMNDRSEMLSGAQILWESLGSDQYVIDRIISVGKVLPDFPSKLLSYVAQRLNVDTLGTYVFCLSAPDQQHPQGPLSMWRAYGGDGAGVSLGFNSAEIAKSYEKTRMPVVLYPVRYETDDKFKTKIREIVDRVFLVAERAAPLWVESDDAVLWGVYQALIIAVATHKHPGFLEEREWRAISFRRFADEDGLLKREVFPFGNSLRVGLRFDLERYAKAVDLSLSELLTKVTIGPSDRQHIAMDAVAHLLDELEVENPHSRIQVCSTPYRANK